MFSKIRGMAALIVFMFMASSLFAQYTRELQFDSWVTGTLHEGDEHWFSVRPSETGIVTVETSGDTDTYLEAYDSSRVLIDENDDGGESYNAKLGIHAEAGKTYLFKVRGFDGDDSGPYHLRASFEPIRDLRFGDWVSGALRKGEDQWFSIRTEAAGIVMVETSGDTDTYLEAYAASGPSIANDDDGGDGLNARLEIGVEAASIYRIKLSLYGENNGPYRIRAHFEPFPPDMEQNTERSRAAPIKLGEAIHVYLHTVSESRWYRYDIPRPETLFVVQTRGNMDMFLSLYDADGKLIKEDDDSGEGKNALISHRLGPGTVYIQVKEYSNQTGHCTLHAETR